MDHDVTVASFVLLVANKKITIIHPRVAVLSLIIRRTVFGGHILLLSMSGSQPNTFKDYIMHNT